ncbi:MAG: NADH-quinone oxidoreductase subunit NuoF [Anaerolineaceae bacterium]
MTTVRSLVLVSNDPESKSKGSEAIFDALIHHLQRFGLEEEVSVSFASDIGQSYASPLVIIYPEAVIYGPVKLSDVPILVEEHIYKGRIIEEKRAPAKLLSGRIAWLAVRKGTLPAENRIVLKNVGQIDPDSIEEYLGHDGYSGFATALSMSPNAALAMIKESGLRGRGGAGFPTGLKWGFVKQAAGNKKYVVCNADESEPGTFKDRMVLEGDPHAIVESMLIAGYAVGADEGYIYIRGEYQLAIERIEKAIQQAYTYGFLGDHVLKSDMNFKLHVHTGAGAYICGEETALLESIEGKRGEPRSRPPYPTTEGLWGKPTLINNVETLANVPAILRNGAQWYRGLGTESSPGTKVYTMLGNTNVTGLIEVPMGITLREIITIYAKGMKKAALKFAQTGGSSGSIIPAILQDTPMDFDSYKKAGLSLGSGALLICDEENCIVDIVKVLMNFFCVESCGKCTPCRVGTKRMLDIITDITTGAGKLEQLEQLKSLSDDLYELSNCGLGQSAGTPIRDMLEYFKAEVEAHIKLGVCPTGICPMHA